MVYCLAGSLRSPRVSTSYGPQSIRRATSGYRYWEKNRAMDEAVLGLTAQVVSSYVSNNRLSNERLPELLRTVYQTLSTVETAIAAAASKVEPAVAVKKSVFPDRLLCLVCGQGFSVLKRHL